MDTDGDEGGSLLSFTLYSIVVFTVFFFIRRFIKGAQFNERVSAKDRVVVITGANSGIGFETTRELNLRKAKVYMLCRSEERANEARRNLVRMGCDATRLKFVHCDLDSFESIRKAAKEVLAADDTIDVLINNAGIMFQSKHRLTSDGHEVTWQSNHLGPFLLTELLLPAIKKSSQGRILNVSSMLHSKSSKINLGTIDEKKNFGMFKAYNQSKLANVMHARALTRQLRKEGTHNVIVNSLHPGAVDTGLPRSTFLLKTPFKQITAPFRWFFLKTERDGAQTSLYVALSKRLDGVSGKYFSECSLAKESELALDDQACDDLYNYSLEQTGLAK